MTVHEDDLARPARACIHFVAKAPARAALEQRGLAVFEVGGADLCERFHDALAQAMRFPPYYGHNLDALDECLRELPACVLVVRDAGALWRSAHARGGSLVEAWLSANDDSTRAFHLVFEG